MVAQMSEQRLLRSLSWKDIAVGKVLGSGSFADVYRIDVFDSKAQPTDREADGGTNFLPASDESSLSAPPVLIRKAIQQHYAVKRVNEKVLRDSKRSAIASQDIACEAKILSSLPYHPHIVVLHGLSSGFWDDPSKGFLVLDCLTETLRMRLTRWRYRNSQQKTKSLLFLSRHKKSTIFKEQKERVSHVGLGIAKALRFLHQHKIIYRDLKSSNVGFDVDDGVRLFDFGLAKRCDDSGRRMTGQVGTWRFMAPEVASCDEYGLSADVYSFAILLWEIITLERPFTKITSHEEVQSVIVEKGQRPSLRNVGSPVLRELLRAGWNADANMRPSMASIVHNLEGEISKRLEWSSFG